MKVMDHTHTQQVFTWYMFAHFTLSFSTLKLGLLLPAWSRVGGWSTDIQLRAPVESQNSLICGLTESIKPSWQFNHRWLTLNGPLKRGGLQIGSGKSCNTSHEAAILSQKRKLTSGAINAMARWIRSVLRRDAEGEEASDQTVSQGLTWDMRQMYHWTSLGEKQINKTKQLLWPHAHFMHVRNRHTKATINMCSGKKVCQPRWSIYE